MKLTKKRMGLLALAFMMFISTIIPNTAFASGQTSNLSIIDSIREEYGDNVADSVLKYVSYDEILKFQEIYDSRDSISTYGISESIGNILDELDTLTDTELFLIGMYPGQALTVRSCAKEADEYTNDYYPRWRDGDEGNAYRHAMWNAIMTRNFASASKAKMWADAHEDFTDAELRAAGSWNGFTAFEHTEMDLHNNAKGRECARWYEFWVSTDTLSDKVMEKIDNREMMILVR